MYSARFDNSLFICLIITIYDCHWYVKYLAYFGNCEISLFYYIWVNEQLKLIFYRQIQMISWKTFNPLKTSSPLSTLHCLNDRWRVYSYIRNGVQMNFLILQIPLVSIKDNNIQIIIQYIPHNPNLSHTTYTEIQHSAINFKN